MSGHEIKGNRRARHFFGWGRGGTNRERPPKRRKLRPEGRRACLCSRETCSEEGGSGAGRGNPGRLGSLEPLGAGGGEAGKETAQGRVEGPALTRLHPLPPQHKDDPVSEARSRLPAFGALSLGLMDR